MLSQSNNAARQGLGTGQAFLGEDRIGTKLEAGEAKDTGRRLTASSTKLLTCMVNFLLVFTVKNEDDQPNGKGDQCGDGKLIGESRKSDDAKDSRVGKEHRQDAHGDQGANDWKH